MCRIGINLNTTTPDGTTINSATGRYRIYNSTNNWNVFTINMSNPQTSDVTTLGNYELQVSVTNNVNETSDWSTPKSTFSITNSCGDPPLTCDNWTLGKWSVIGNFGTISVTYIDCDGATQTKSTLLSTPITFCAKQIVSYDLGGDIPPENTPPIQIVNFEADFKGLKGYLGKDGLCNVTETIEPTLPPVQGCSQWSLLGFYNNDQFGDDVYVKYLDCLGNTTIHTAQVSAGASVSFYAYTPVEIFLGGQVYWEAGDGPWPTQGPLGSLNLSNGNLTWNGSEWV
jgi:hypothetical protein